MRYVVVAAMLLCAISIEGAEQSRNSASSVGCSAIDLSDARRKLEHTTPWMLAQPSAPQAPRPQGDDDEDDMSGWWSWTPLESLIVTRSSIRTSLRIGGAATGFLALGGARLMCAVWSNEPCDDDTSNVQKGAYAVGAIGGLWLGLKATDYWIDGVVRTAHERQERAARRAAAGHVDGVDLLAIQW